MSNEETRKSGKPKGTKDRERHDKSNRDSLNKITVAFIFFNFNTIHINILYFESRHHLYSLNSFLSLVINQLVSSIWLCYNIHGATNNGYAVSPLTEGL